MTSDDRPRDSAGKPKGEPADPLEDSTQAMSSSERPRSSTLPSDVSDASDTTTWGGAPPPRIQLEEDETVVLRNPRDSEVDPDDTETLIMAAPVGPPPSIPLAPSSSLRPMLLERIEPSLGRGERMRLDTANWRASLGRAEESDIRLFTASASREHAGIAGSENGDWILTPAKDKSVMIDGEPVAEPIVLEVGMNIILGQDHLRCVTEGLGHRAAAAATVADGLNDSAGLRIGRLGIAGLIVGAVTLMGFAAWALIRLSGD
jgi:hypothetical protein